MVEPGRRCLGDRYELEQLIAAGGMGQVWRGCDVLLGRPVAVKVLRSEYTGDPTFLARFRAEAQHAASLSHPNIAAVFDYGEVVADDGSGETLAYLVMELVDGEPLSAVLRSDAPLDIPTSLSILEQTAHALADAHRVGMIHRDVKPGNILVTADGGVKITDFGIAWSAGSVPLTRTGQVIGTAQYLSPEQAEGRHATPASDVYALGLVGYECLTGRPAFDGDNPVTIALKQVRQEPDPLPGELPAPVRGLIMRALVKDPGLRYPDAAAFAAALADAAAGRSTAAVELPAAAAGLPPASVPPPGSRPAGDPPTHAGASRASRISPPVHHRRRTVTAVLVPLIALLVGAVIAAVVLQGLSRDNTPSPAAATNKLADPGIVLAAETYVGRPVDEVADDLAHRGLQVQRRAVDVPGAVPDLVTDVSPVGTQLALGDVVVVSYVAERAATGTGAGRGNGTWSTQRSDATVLGDGPPAAPTGSPTAATGSSSSAAATTSSSPPTTTAAASSAPETSAGTTSSSPTTSSSTSTSTSRSTSTSAATSTATTARR